MLNHFAFRSQGQQAEDQKHGYRGRLTGSGGIK